MEAHMFASILLEEAGPNTELSWLLYLFLAFFSLMVLVGWWVSRRNGKQVEGPHKPPAHHEEPVSHAEPAVADVPQEAAVVAIPETPAVPAPVAVAVPDDLVRLEGIGPRVARVLNDGGITTFAALASSNAANVQKILSAAG